MKDFDFRHNHYTRDVRPHDCPACRIQQLESQVTELEQVAESWMKDYQALKDKYEPEMVVTTDYEEAQRMDNERDFVRYDSPRRVTVEKWQKNKKNFLEK